MARARRLIAAIVAVVVPLLAAGQGQPAGAAPPAAQGAPPAAPPAAAAVAAPASATPQGQPVAARILLKDGQQLRGKLVSRDESGATLELEGGTRVVVPAASIERIDVAKPGRTEVWSEDPNRTRYLYSPSGFMLRQGEGYISQTELIVTSVSYGLTDWLTVGVGSSIPFLFVEDGVNLLGTVKAGGSITRYVHLAAVATTLWLPAVDAGTTAGLVGATLTLGTPDLNVGVAGGPPFVVGTEVNEVGDFAFSVSGNWRVSERIALITENWIVGKGYAVSGAVRFIGQRLGVDAGLIFVEGATVPIPWLDFTFSFGRR